MKDWDVFDNIIYYPPVPGGDGGEVPEQVLNDLYNHINNTTIHVTQEMINKLKDTITSRDIVFKMVSPFTLGVQEETEFLYPDKGFVTNVSISISLESTTTTNVIIATQYYDNNTWKDINVSQIQVGQKQVSTGVNNLEINNTRLRIVLIDGDVEYIKNMSLIVKVNNSPL